MVRSLIVHLLTPNDNEPCQLLLMLMIRTLNSFQMLAAILNYLMILIQFRYNDKKQLAEEQAMYNITTTPLPPLFGLLIKHDHH